MLTAAPESTRVKKTRCAFSVIQQTWLAGSVVRCADFVFRYGKVEQRWVKLRCLGQNTVLYCGNLSDKAVLNRQGRTKQKGPSCFRNF